MNSNESSAIVLAPVSARLAGLLHELQAQVLKDIQAGNDGRAVPPGAIVLQPRSKCRKYVYTDSAGVRSVTCHFEKGEIVSLACYRAVQAEHSLHPGCWYGDETLCDEQGRTWRHYTGAHVINDFGDLVPAKA